MIQTLFFFFKTKIVLNEYAQNINNDHQKLNKNQMQPLIICEHEFNENFYMRWALKVALLFTPLFNSLHINNV